MRYVWAIVFALGILPFHLMAQTPGGTWGAWSRLTTATTGIETRVKCEYSFESDSMWAYQFKNVTARTVDIVEKEQHALANSRANGLGAGSMFTLEPGKVSFPYEGTMHGTCPQLHNLKIEFVCVVPHGQDHPCFKNGDGTEVVQKEEPKDTSKTSPPVQIAASPPVQIATAPSNYAYCDARTGSGNVSIHSITETFANSLSESELNSAFSQWFHSTHTVAAADEGGYNCSIAPTKQTADAWRQDAISDYQKPERTQQLNGLITRVNTLVWQP